MEGQRNPRLYIRIMTKSIPNRPAGAGADSWKNTAETRRQTSSSSWSATFAISNIGSPFCCPHVRNDPRSDSGRTPRWRSGAEADNCRQLVSKFRDFRSWVHCQLPGRSFTSQGTSGQARVLGARGYLCIQYARDDFNGSFGPLFRRGGVGTGERCGARGEGRPHTHGQSLVPARGC
jgi:hypothetical protein